MPLTRRLSASKMRVTCALDLLGGGAAGRNFHEADSRLS